MPHTFAEVYAQYWYLRACRWSNMLYGGLCKASTRTYGVRQKGSGKACVNKGHGRRVRGGDLRRRRGACLYAGRHTSKCFKAYICAGEAVLQDQTLNLVAVNAYQFLSNGADH